MYARIARKTFSQDFAIGANNDYSSRFDLLHFTGILLENRHEGSSFRGEGNHLIVTNEETGTNSQRISHNEGIAIPGDPGDHVTAVPIPSCITKDGSKVETLPNPFGNLGPGNTFGLGLGSQLIVGRIQIITGFLQNGLGVRVENRVLSAFNQTEV